MNKIRIKETVFLLILIAGLYLVFWNHQADQLNEESLRRTAQKILQLENSKNYSRIYDEYISPEAKAKTARNEFIKLHDEAFGGMVKSQIEIHDIDIIGTRGYVDRTRIDCHDDNCSSTNKVRLYRAYLYINGRWYIDILSEVPLCIRQEKYQMPDEFQRALSLIIQRGRESQLPYASEWAEQIKEISNCLNIQYAQSEDQIDRAEGAFFFNPGQSPKRLDILVSPKYKIKDDLVTAALLVHEITHAIQFVNELTTEEMKLSCFEKEAGAFNDQGFFLSLLNQEEMASLNARWFAGNSPAVSQLTYVYITIPKYSGTNTLEKSLNFVKSSPVYQKLCYD